MEEVDEKPAAAVDSQLSLSGILCNCLHILIQAQIRAFQSTKNVRLFKSEEDVLNIPGLDNFNKQFLVQRKEYMNIVIVLLFIYIVYTLNSDSNTIKSVPSDDLSYPDDEYFQSFQELAELAGYGSTETVLKKIYNIASLYVAYANTGFHATLVICLFFVICARITWMNYRASTRLIFVSYNCKNVLPIISLYIPYR